MKIKRQAAVVAAIVMAFGLAATFTACKDETDAPCNHTITKVRGQKRQRFIDGNDEFKGSGTLIRLAANKAEGADGWLPFVKNAAICIGVGNPRCVF